MYYLVLLAGVLSFLTMVALVDPSGRRRLSVRSPSVPSDDRARSIADIAAATASRFGGASGEILRVPPSALEGARQEDQPCLTPIDCVMGKRCAGHCRCR